MIVCILIIDDELFKKYIDKNNKIIIYKITNRWFITIFHSHCNQNINGNCIIANSDIIYDKTLNILKYLNDDDFSGLTRDNLKNGETELIKFKENKINILSQDS